MPSFSLGLQSPWWLLVLLIVTSVALSLWYYSRTVPAVSAGRRALLVTLRALGLSLLILLLAEPVLSLLRSSTVRPRVTVLIDQSESMKQRDAGTDRAADVQRVLTRLPLGNDNEDVDVYGFDASVHPLNSSERASWSFNGSRTDIERALRFVADNAERDNTEAVVLLSDGTVTAGANPLFVAEQLAKPVYVIGVGDSSEPKDVAVQSLVTNDVVFVKTSVPVRVTLQAHGYEGMNARLSLLDDDVVVQSVEIPLSKNQPLVSHVFQYDAVKAGIHKLSARVAGVDGELTTRNNVMQEFVKVRDDTRNVLLIAGAPSPDVAFIRTVFESMQGVKLSSIIQKAGADIYPDASNASAVRDADLVVFVGFPVASTSSTLLKQVCSDILRMHKPLLFVASQSCDYSKLRMLDEILPFTVQTSGSQELSVTLDVSQSDESDALLRLSDSRSDLSVWNSLPPIFRTETFVRVKPESRIVAGMKVNNVPISDPLIVTRNVQKSRCIAVLGYGIFRWKLLGTALDKARGSAQAPDVLSAFLGNSVKWLGTDDDERKVRIRTSRSLYAAGEKAEITAQVYDDAMVPVDDATVTVNLIGGAQQRSVVLAALGSGRYSSTVEGLPSGDYSFQGTVSVRGSAYGKDAGRFSVGDLPLEFRDLRMNASLLRAVAQRTGGTFRTTENADGVFDDIHANAGFRPRSVTRSTDWDFSSMAEILALAIAAFGLEWLVRKRTGMI